MKKNRAFTLIELMVVILILAILAALVVPNVLNKTSTAKVGKAKADLAVLRDAIDLFRVDCDRYPTTQEGLDALRNPPSGASGWHGPYLQKDLGNDPWGNPYIYQTPGPNGKDGYLVESYGADGAPGGEGDNADIQDGAD
jgi:general secretion pathway protein G